MSRVEDDITRQLHLCACLMSDPLIMREQSVYVADQFVTAMNKIEQLQQYLRPPDDPCARHNWIDNTVLTVGVRRMVWFALGKHMEPLRWRTAAQLRHAVLKGDKVVEGSRNAAPKIFIRGFNEDKFARQHGETPIAREIKETNCMASLVLLYYYLNWHVLLLLLNRVNHGCVGGRDHELEVDLRRLFQGLPGFADTFEFRVLRSFLHKNHDSKEERKVDEADRYDIWSSDDDSGAEDDEGIVQTEETEKPDGPGNKEGGGEDGKIIGESESVESGLSYADRVGAYRARVLTLIDDFKNGVCLSEFLSSLSTYDDELNSKNDDDIGKKRKGGLMGIYRMTLCLTHHADKDEHILNNALVSCYGALPSQLSTKSRDLLTQHKLKESIMLLHEEAIVRARVFSLMSEHVFNMGMYSVYNVQEDAQRWFDMYRPFHITSFTNDASSAYGQQQTQTKYTPVLANVLNNDPYKKLLDDANVKQTKRLCIHDFNNASMMMDVVRSYHKLHELILALMNEGGHGSDIKRKIIVFVMQTYASDKTLSKFLNAVPSIDGYDLKHPLVDNGWLSVPIGNHKSTVDVTDSSFSRPGVDEIAGYYWGSSVSNHETVNHRYLAWPQRESSGYGQAMKVVMFILTTLPAASTHSHYLILESSLRNSLFIRSIGQSILALINGLECTVFFDNVLVKVKNEDTIHGPGFIAMNSSASKDGTKALGQDPISSEDDDAERIPLHMQADVEKYKDLFQKLLQIKFNSVMNKSKLVSQLKSEMASLKYRVSEVERGAFKLYCGTSWPVKAPGENTTVFGAGIAVPRVLSDRLINAAEYQAHLWEKHPPGGIP